MKPLKSGLCRAGEAAWETQAPSFLMLCHYLPTDSTS